MQNIKFSIIVPVYNISEYIERCVKSIFMQAYKNIEMILVNDGSTDESGEILEKLEKENPECIKVVRQENRGAGAARNHGVRHATGDFFMFVDGDDYLLPGCIPRLYDCLNKKQYDIVLFNLFTAKEKGRINTVQEINGKMRGEQFPGKNKTLLRIPTLPVCKLYRREWYLNNQIQFPEKIIYEDVPIVPFAISRAGRIFILDEAFYVYIQRKGSTMHRKPDKKCLDIIASIRYLIELFEEAGEYERYRDEIENIVIHTAFFQVLENINMSDYKSIFQEILVDSIQGIFPDILENVFLTEPEKQRLRLLLDRSFKEYYYKYGFRKKLRNWIREHLPCTLYYWLCLSKRTKRSLEKTYEIT